MLMIYQKKKYWMDQPTCNTMKRTFWKSNKKKLTNFDTMLQSDIRMHLWKLIPVDNSKCIQLSIRSQNHLYSHFGYCLRLKWYIHSSNILDIDDTNYFISIFVFICWRFRCLYFLSFIKFEYYYHQNPFNVIIM